MPELLVTWSAANSVNNRRKVYVSIPLTQWLAGANHASSNNPPRKFCEIENGNFVLSMRYLI